MTLLHAFIFASCFLNLHNIKWYLTSCSTRHFFFLFVVLLLLRYWGDEMCVAAHILHYSHDRHNRVDCVQIFFFCYWLRLPTAIRSGGNEMKGTVSSWSGYVRAEIVAEWWLRQVYKREIKRLDGAGEKGKSKSASCVSFDEKTCFYLWLKRL